jgi:phage terminase large subunit GpA-like protein
LLLTAAADVQANAIYVEVLAFTADRQSWVVEALVLDGDTSDPEAAAFAKLAQLFETEWPDSFGGRRRVDAFGFDSGFRANVVYNWCRVRPGAFALKGGDGWSRPAISTPSLVDVDLHGKNV